MMLCGTKANSKSSTGEIEEGDENSWIDENTLRMAKDLERGWEQV